MSRELKASHMATVDHIHARIFAFLLKKALTHDTATYEEIALKFGLPSSGNGLGASLSPKLGHILTWCQAHGLPPISVLVVRKSGAQEGLPGRGFWSMVGLEELDDEAKRVVTTKLQKDVYEIFGSLERPGSLHQMELA